MHISICVCTYLRPHLLLRLLNGLCELEINNQFSYSIIIADNDSAQSASQTVRTFSQTSPVEVIYCVEPIRSISLARNKAIKHATGDMIAFIDDDECPSKNWLSSLFYALKKYQVSGIFGPVRPHFDEPPPKWIINSRIFERPEHPTGFIMPWRECRTGNVLIKSKIIKVMGTIFDPSFGAGASDIDLFRRLIEAGHKFAWCNEACVYEVVSPNRWKRSFMISRALLRGRISLLHPGDKVKPIMKSLVVIPIYGLGLPFLQVLGHHYFMIYLIKLIDHLGRVLALIGINPIQERKM